MRALHQDEPLRIGGIRLVGVLGEGAIAQVFVGATAEGKPVAVKAVRASAAREPGFRARFAREVSAASRMESRYAVPVVDADTAGPTPWLATAYLPGPSLAEAVESHGRLPGRTVRALAAGIADALAALHEVGLTHGRLAPHHVAFAPDGPRIVDLGVARSPDGPTVTDRGVVVGTVLPSPGFRSPEQLDGRTAEAASDVFSLGSLLAFAATGTPPFGADDEAGTGERVLRGEPDLGGLPDWLRELVAACVAKDPADRPTAAQIRTATATEEDGLGWLPSTLSAEVAQRAAAVWGLTADGTPRLGAEALAADDAAEAVFAPVDAAPARPVAPGRPSGNRLVDDLMTGLAGAALRMSGTASTWDAFAPRRKASEEALREVGAQREAAGGAGASGPGSTPGGTWQRDRLRESTSAPSPREDLVVTAAAAAERSVPPRPNTPPRPANAPKGWVPPRPSAPPGVPTESGGEVPAGAVPPRPTTAPQPRVPGRVPPRPASVPGGGGGGVGGVGGGSGAVEREGLAGDAGGSGAGAGAGSESGSGSGVPTVPGARSGASGASAGSGASSASGPSGPSGPSATVIPPRPETPPTVGGPGSADKSVPDGSPEAKVAADASGVAQGASSEVPGGGVSVGGVAAAAASVAAPPRPAGRPAVPAAGGSGADAGSAADDSATAATTTDGFAWHGLHAVSGDSAAEMTAQLRPISRRRPMRQRRHSAAAVKPGEVRDASAAEAVIPRQSALATPPEAPDAPTALMDGAGSRPADGPAAMDGSPDPARNADTAAGDGDGADPAVDGAADVADAPATAADSDVERREAPAIEDSADVDDTREQPGVSVAAGADGVDEATAAGDGVEALPASADSPTPSDDVPRLGLNPATPTSAAEPSAPGTAAEEDPAQVQDAECVAAAPSESGGPDSGVTHTAAAADSAEPPVPAVLSEPDKTAEANDSAEAPAPAAVSGPEQATARAETPGPPQPGESNGRAGSPDSRSAGGTATTTTPPGDPASANTSETPLAAEQSSTGTTPDGTSVPVADNAERVAAATGAPVESGPGPVDTAEHAPSDAEAVRPAATAPPASDQRADVRPTPSEDPRRPGTPTADAPRATRPRRPHTPTAAERAAERAAEHAEARRAATQRAEERRAAQRLAAERRAEERREEARRAQERRAEERRAAAAGARRRPRPEREYSGEFGPGAEPRDVEVVDAELVDPDEPLPHLVSSQELLGWFTEALPDRPQRPDPAADSRAATPDDGGPRRGLFGRKRRS